MRFAKVLLILIGVVAASPALADDVVILRGSSAPPVPWYEPPPQPQVQTVYVPVYYVPFAYGTFVQRHAHRSFAPRNR